MINRILIVDDHGLVRIGIRMMLRMQHPQCEIDEAAGYQEAVVAMSAQHYDVILLDFDLRAEKSGLDLLAHIRSQGMPVRVIMLSANDDPDLVLRCISAGASGYIPKSSQDEHIFEHALETIFNDGIYLPASVVNTSGVARTAPPVPAPPLTCEQLGLSPRQAEVLYFLCQGLPNKAIANRMGINEGTVRKNYVTELMRMFGVTRRTELMLAVFNLGLRVPAPASAMQSNGLKETRPLPEFVRT